MKYSKPPLSIPQQVDLLLSRGMTGDPCMMADRLTVVNYYRLSGYWYPFRIPDSDYFKAGASFQNIWRRYAFDRRLRLHVIDAIERIEVAVRSMMALGLACHRDNPFAYADDAAELPGMSSRDRERFLNDLKTDTQNSKETFAEHFRTKYGDRHPYMPVWMACEIMTFGTMLTLYRACHWEIRKSIADRFGITEEVLNSWLLTLNIIRNICAHHGRLWNRQLGVKPKIPRKQPVWHQPVEVDNNRIFGVLTICKYCLDIIAPQSRWTWRLNDLLADYTDIPIISMGFPDRWQSCPIWKSQAKLEM
jgi:abortive infection bacteriophage resistance protein